MIFAATQNNTVEVQMPKWCTNNYCSWTPSYRSVK